MTEQIRPEHTGTILVVESNVPFGELIAGVLRSAGYRCETVINGQMALAALSGGAVALLVIDYNMTDMPFEDFVTAMGSVENKIPLCGHGRSGRFIAGGADDEDGGR